MFDLSRRWLPIVLLALAALWLRTHDLARRPMHADEANQAVKTGQLLETGDYRFDPTDHHGPTLYYAALPLAWLRGESTLVELSETTVRLVPALAGTFAVVLLYLLALPRFRTAEVKNLPPKFPLGALYAAAFLAVSPPAVYYSRYFVQETLLLAFVLGTFVGAQRWWLRGHLGWAIVTGICAGLAVATKATALLFFLVAALALIVVRPFPPVVTRYPRPVSAALLAAFVFAALFYSSFGSNIGGLRDALDSYTHAFARAGGPSGHEKPWWYYLRLFSWIRNGGLTFQQLAFSILALAGAGVVLRRRLRARDAKPDPFLCWAAVYTLFIAAVISFTPYKTPWHVIHLVPGLALLAASALAALPHWGIAIPFAVLVFSQQLHQTKLVAFLRPADARNPFAYVHSSTDVLKIHPLVAAALARSPGGVVRIISEEYWPIPWYLRSAARVGYWATPPDDCDGALVIAAETQADVVRARLRGRYRESFLGLRPGFLCVVFTPEP